MTTWKFINLINVLFVFLILGCTQSEYSKLVSKELAKDQRRDSVVLGLQLGDTRKIFQDKCMELNKQKLVTMGPKGAVLYYVKDSTDVVGDSDMRLLIIPEFDEQEKISGVNLEFSYESWAPWNKRYQADSLKLNLMSLFKEWYRGNDFISIDIDNTSVPVKVDGNRRIILKIKDSQTVLAMVQDLKHKKYLGK